MSYEFAPEKAVHLNDNSAFDAFVEYRRPGIHRGFIGIETKLSEPFSQQLCTLDSGYSTWFENSKSWWKKGAESVFSTKQYNQLWRNHLLCFSMLNQTAPAFQEGFVAVVHHSDEPTCAPAILAYEHSLTPVGRATLLDWPLDELVRQWGGVLASRAEREWLNAFQLRYLDLNASKFQCEEVHD